MLAVPATTGKSIFKFANEIEAMLLETKYNSTINIGIATEPHWKLPPNLREVYGILIPRLERQVIAGIGIELKKGLNKVKMGELLDVMLDSSHGFEYLNMSDEAILNIILPELENYFPKLSQSIRLTHFTRWKEAEPISSVGRSKNIKKYKEALSSKAQVILAGDYMGFPYTESAAFSGKWAADFIKRADSR